MTWYAKPSGGYPLTSEEGKANMFEMRDHLLRLNYTYEAITGVIANSVYEGGLNPWRWESDIYPPQAERRGCGLFGFTPYAKYLALDGSNQMNLSTTTVTPNANPNVGEQQMSIMSSGRWGWIPSCWRNYWSISMYEEQYALRTQILNTYGNGVQLTQEQYSKINDIPSAVFAFLACFEGPNVPNYDDRMSVATNVYEIIKGATPPVPPRERKSMPVYMMIKRFL